MRTCTHRNPDGTACAKPTERTRCAIHERAHQRQRGSPTARGLDAEYQRNRAIVMAEAQGRCYSPGCTTPATTCDHIKPRRDGGTNDVGNLRSACVKHNSGRR